MREQRKVPLEDVIDSKEEEELSSESNPEPDLNKADKLYLH